MADKTISKTIRLPKSLSTSVEKAVAADKTGEDSFSKFTREALRDAIARKTGRLTPAPRRAA